MTWEEIIIDIRTKPEFSDLVKHAYFEENLQLNLSRFIKSSEFVETLKLLSGVSKVKNPKLLDIGAGNGISSVGFALNGYTVTALEPDKSDTIGAGAIRKLADANILEGLEVISSYAEEMPFNDNTFDIVYVRQAMHHSYHLQDFLQEISRVLKVGGILLTVRDHVINDDKGLQEFLVAHPLHKFYGGENAFTLAEYKEAIEESGLKIQKELGPLDSPINYFPLNRRNAWRIPLPQILFKPYLAYVKAKTNNKYADQGRLYSFLAKKI